MSTEPQSRVLKADVARTLDAIQTFNYDEIRQRCLEYIEEIRLQAREMLESATSESEQIRQQAFSDAREAGYAEGLRQAEHDVQVKAQELCAQNMATTLPALQAAAAALNEERDVWRAEWESIAIRFSALIAKKLIRRELSQCPELSTEMVLKTLELASGSSNVRLLLNPQDMEQLGEQGLQQINEILRSADSQLVADESISPGGCVIHTQHGKIDAQIETQLDRICAELVL